MLSGLLKNKNLLQDFEFIPTSILCLDTQLYPYGYKRIMYTIIRTKIFDAWLSKLKDARGKARIVERIRSAERGNFGDCEPVGNGVSDLRIHFGPGYRVYFAKRGMKIG